MTPTPSFILLIAILWSFPASYAVITYRIHGSSMESVKDAFRLAINDASKALSLQPQPQAQVRSAA